MRSRSVPRGTVGIVDRLDVDAVAASSSTSLIRLHCTGSPTITGTMWLGFAQVRDAGGVEPARARAATRSLLALALGRAGLEMADAGRARRRRPPAAARS